MVRTVSYIYLSTLVTSIRVILLTGLLYDEVPNYFIFSTHSAKNPK